MPFGRHVLEIDAAREIARLTSFLRDAVRTTMRRHGAVVGLSGGVDSSVVLALCAEAFGPEKVLAVLMPEKESEPDSERLARHVARRFRVPAVVEDITAALDGLGCYARRDAAIRRMFPEYDPSAGYRAKLVLPPNLLEEGTLNVFSVAMIKPGGEQVSRPAPIREFLEIVAASSFKQRTRMSVLYYHAELNRYAAVGTANRNEHDQGFFVKYGDGGVDVNPIAHLYKTQVYALAEYLDVPEEVRRRPPTTDTYSAPGTQQEFFFRLPFETMDLLWYAMENGVPVPEVATAMGLSEDQVLRAFDDLARKRRTTEYLRMAPLGVADAAAVREMAR